jgi:prepilin-type N-terminal cleavage/methylation domain-containing protein
LLNPPRPRPAPENGRDDGFTLIELLVVTLIMGIVIAIAGAVLYSLSTTANRNDSMVNDEQAASTVLAQLSRDIRSANTLTFPAGALSTDTPSEVELIDNQPAGGTLSVLWVYNASAATLTRKVLVGSAFATSGTVLSRVVNPAGSPVFSYLDGKSGTSISGQSPATIALCATGVNVDLFVAPKSAARGVATFEESAEVALTNQLATLTAPGNGQC